MESKNIKKEKSTSIEKKSVDTALTFVNSNFPLMKRYNAVLKELEELEIISSKSYKTNKKVKYDNEIITIDTIIDKELLIKILAKIVLDEQSYTEAAKRLELKKFPVYKYNSSEIHEWVHDIKLRIDIIENETKRLKCTMFKEKVEKRFTDEHKDLLLMSEIDAELDLQFED